MLECWEEVEVPSNISIRVGANEVDVVADMYVYLASV